VPDLKTLYLVVAQVEGTVQPPFAFHLFESAQKKADKIASDSDPEEDDVRIFEFDLTTMKSLEIYVPEMFSSPDKREEE